MADDLKNTAPEPKRERSMCKEIWSVLGAIVPFVWDWFWDFFNLRPVGDAMKDHSLPQKRAGVVIILVFILCAGGWMGFRLTSKQAQDYKDKWDKSETKLGQLQTSMLAGTRSTNYSIAELMGFHDVTNWVISTNVMKQEAWQTNTIVRFLAKPLLSFNSLLRIKEKLEMSERYSVTIACHSDETDACELASQLKEVFEASGFQIKGFHRADFKGKFFTNDFHGVTISFSEIPAAISINAFNQIFKELNQPQQYSLENRGPTNAFSRTDLWIIVTANK